MKYVISPDNDYKAIAIGKELKSLGITMITLNSSFKLPFAMIIYFFKKKKKPQAIIYRYLNDYPSIIKTMLRTFIELSGVLLAFVLRIKVIWICHNVDRESVEYFPKITNMRRYVLEKQSDKIMVTDPLLVPHAEKQFPKSKDKIDYITFGKSVSTKNENSAETVEKIKKFVMCQKQINKDIQIGFVAGNINWKTSQFEKIPELIYVAENIKQSIAIVVIGPIGTYLNNNNKPLYEELKKNKKILFLDGYHHLDLKEITKFIDFYWRVYLDLSLPWTVYEAAQYKKPILTQNIGFLGEVVKKYSIGYILEDDFSNLSFNLEKISNWDKNKSTEFIETHTWKIAAKRIFNVI